MDSFFSIGKKPVKLSLASNILLIASVRRTRRTAAEKQKGEPGSPFFFYEQPVGSENPPFHTGLYMAPLSAELTILA